LDVDAAVTSIAAQSTGDGLSVVATPQGAHLRAAYQQLQADVTAEGLSLGSTAPRGGALTLRADRLGRGNALRSLSRAGTVAVHGTVVTFARPGLHEEFSTGVDGLRQDFVVADRPEGTGALTVELALTGATAERSGTPNAATLTLANSGRELAYSRLHVVDARGATLTARLDVLAGNRLAIAVDDANAVYPVRIDPIFSDAHWVSLNGDIAGVDAGVRASVTDAAGNVYVGGNFLLAGSTVVNRIAKWDPTTSTWSGLGTGMNGLVSALALSSDGSLYAVGSFTTAGGVPANRVARWDPGTSTWSALGAGTNLAATVVAVDGTGNVYVGGAGTFGNATPGTVRIAKWNGTTWSPLGPGLNGVPSAMVFDASGNLYVGGGFTATQGNAVALSRVAKWTPSTSTWSALGSGVSFSITATPGVAALAIDSSGNLFVGGGFDTAGGVSASRIAMWNGTSWSALGSGFNSTANALAFDSSGTLYAGGFFSTAGGVSTGTVARWDGSSWSAAGAGPGVVTYTLAANGTDVYAGGDFASVGFVSAPFIARFSGSTSQWSSLGGGTDGQVYAVTTMGSDLYVGGSFTRIGGIAAKNIARWNGTNWSAVGPGLNAYVRALAVVGGNLYAGGTFTATADGTVATKLIGRWNGSSWSVLSGGAYDTPAGFGFTHIGALAVMGTDLYAGGLRVNRLGGVVTGNLAKFDTILGTWAPVDAGFLPTSLEALTVSGTDLYVGGAFATAGGITVNNIAKWSTSTHTWSGFGPGLNNRVWALATIGTDVYAGGIFGATFDNAVPLVRIAKWNGTAWSAMGSGAPNNSVNAFAVSGTDLYVGGSFLTAGGLASPNIAKWDGSAWSTMGSGINGTVNALAHDASGHLFVGGLFGVAGTTVSPMIVQATLDPPPTAVAGIDQSIDATSAAGATATLDGSASSDPENDPLTYTWRDAASTIVGTTAVVSPTVPFGTHTYTLTVLDSHGNTASDSVVVTVQDHFTITVTTPPVISATYTFGQQVPAAYSCTDSAGLIASCVGPVANGADIDTSSLGAHTFEVTATNTRGDMSSLSTAYSVVQGGSTTVVTCPVSVTYTGAAQTPCTVSVTGAGGLSLTPVATHASNTDVGTASASYTFAGDANHAGSSASASFEITRAQLTVTANDKARADLGLNPLFDGTIVGAAAGDGITATYTATVTTVPGTYPIVPTLVDPADRLGNYTVIVNNGTLTVFDTQPPTLTVPSGLTAEAVDSA
ncbi:MAG: MBG domain-containing protein, partial [Vicinamibacterales bacterium]